ncbi:MAG: ABC transporter permease [Chloroflexi bacterium]|nr:ABC transporter permease [Chloroflexota bacterium]
MMMVDNVLTAPKERAYVASGWWASQVAFLRRVVRVRGAGFGLVVVLFVLLLAIFAGQVSPYDPVAQDSNAILAGPSPAHLLGADELGRDVLSRLIYGARPSLEAGAISVSLALLLGIPMGLLAGYFGHWVDQVLMRLADALWSFPGLVLALAVESILGTGLVNAMVAIGVVYAPVFARLVQAQTLSAREEEYVSAARCIGAGDVRIMTKHIWPNLVAPVAVQGSLMLGQAIIFEAALSFLGLGVQPPDPAWGSMLRTAYQYMQLDPWYSLFPGGAIFMTVLGFNLLGDGIRQALDPRMRNR